MHPRAALAWAVAASLGCAGAQHLEVTLGQAKLHPIRLIAVYPTALRFEAPAYRSYELAMDQVEALVATGRLMALGPDEFAQLDWPSNFLYASTNLSGKLTALGLRPTEVAGLRGWIERREQRGSQQLYDAKGRPSGQTRSAEVSYVIHEDLIGSESDELIASGSLEITVDPFAEHPAWDDAPELRQAVKTLACELLHKAGPALRAGPQVEELPFEAAWVPWGEERFSMPGRPALTDTLSTLDPVSAEAARLLRLSFFEADLLSAEQNAMLGLPAGLWVRRVPGRLEASGLERGDLITSVESDPAAGPQTFLRWASAKRPGAPVNITVRRGEQVVHLKIPAPER
jgi:hypothetical protein